MGNETFTDLVSGRWWIGQLVTLVLALFVGAFWNEWRSRRVKRSDAQLAHDDRWTQLLLARSDLVPLQAEILAHARWWLSVSGVTLMLSITTFALTLTTQSTVAIGVSALVVVSQAIGCVRALRAYNRQGRVYADVVNAMINSAWT